MTTTATRLNLNARKRRGLATVYRIVLQNMHDLGVRLTAKELEEFTEAMVWIREQTKEQRFISNKLDNGIRQG